MFAKILIQLLDTEDKTIVSWGKNSFIIHDIKRFERESIPKYFPNTQLFYSQLNMYGFVRGRSILNEITYNMFDSNQYYCTPTPNITLDQHIPIPVTGCCANDWVVCIASLTRFAINAPRLTWGLDKKVQNTTEFLTCAKPGDRLWFVSNIDSHPLLAIATYCSHEDFVDWPLIDIDMSHDVEKDGCCCQGCWQHHGKHNEQWNVKIRYNNLYKTSDYTRMNSSSIPEHISSSDIQVLRHNPDRSTFNLEVCYSLIMFTAS